MPFSRRPTSRLLIESQTLTIWPWNDLDLGVTLTSFMTLTSEKWNWCPGAKLAFSMKWPWPWSNDIGITLTLFMTFTSDKSNQVKTDVQVAKLAFSWDDLDLGPMTLILELDLDIVKMYHHTKNEVSMSIGSKVSQWRTRCEGKGFTQNLEFP